MNEKLFYGLMKLRSRMRLPSALRRHHVSRSDYVQPEEFFGVPFKNALGIAGLNPDGRCTDALSHFGFGFVTAGPILPDKRNTPILEAIPWLKSRAGVRIAAMLARRPGDLRDDLVLDDYRIPFSLLYDFVDFFIVETDLEQLGDITDVLDELLSLRLCYDTSRPILLKLPVGTPPAELDELVSFCLLSGIEGVVAEDEAAVRQIVGKAQGRMLVAGSSRKLTVEKAQALRNAGATLLLMDGGLAHLGGRTPKRILQALKNTPEAL